MNLIIIENLQFLVCDVCQVAFRQKDGLKRHMKTRHNIDMKTEKANDKIIGFVDLEENDEQMDDDENID